MYDEEEREIKKSNSKNAKRSAKSAKKSRAIIEDDDDDDDDDEIIMQQTASKIKSNLNDDDDDEEDEEVDEEAFKQEFNDFIDDNDEDDDEEIEEDDEDKHHHKKHKKSKKKKSKKKKKKKQYQHQEESESDSGESENSASDDNSELEEEDLDLIKNNLNLEDLEEVGIAPKKRRRIKIESESESSEEEQRKQIQQQSRKEKKKRHSPKKHRNDTNIEEAEESNIEQEDLIEEEQEERIESDEEGSFIVDDSDDEAKTDENKRGSRAMQQRRKRTYNDEAQQEALDIFGVNVEELGAISDDDNENEDEEDYEEELEEDEEEADEDDEEKEDDDDLTQKAAKKRQRQRRLKVMHKIEDIFEPQELEKNLLTEFDQQIRIEDKPERFMLRSLPVTSEPDEAELEREANWIYTQAFLTCKAITNTRDFKLKPTTAVEKIKEALNFIRNEFLEVPFIANYRKEHISPDLDIYDLWKVYEYDEKYCQLKQRKENLVKLFERMRRYLNDEKIPDLNNKRMKRVYSYDDEEGQEVEDEQVVNLLDSMRMITDKDINRVRSTETVEELIDCYQHFNLHYSNDMIGMKEFELKETIKSKKSADSDEANMDMLINLDIDNDILESAKFMKYASRKERLFYCRQAGLENLARKFGLTCEQYGEILAENYQVHEIDQCDIEPTQLALDYVKEPNFQTSEQVLSTVRYMISIQLAREPSVRQLIRDMFMQNACITVRPTMPRGFKEIDESHPCFKFKYLNSKPVRTLKNDEFLTLYIAEQDNLIQLKIETLKIVDNDPPTSRSIDINSDKTPRTILEKLKSFFHKDEFSYNVEQWNQQRAEIIEDMYLKFLVPDFEKELRSKLLYEAKQFVFSECQKKIEKILAQAPLRADDNLGEDQAKSGHVDFNEHGLNVLAITFTTSELDENGGLASVAVASFVNGAGELDEFVRVRNFNVKLTQNREFQSKQREEKIEDLNALEDFIVKKEPNVIIINNENKDALTVLDDIRYMLSVLVEKRHIKLGSIRVEIIDNEIAKLFEASKQQEFGTTIPGLVKQGICLARYVQDPLLCYSQLCNLDRDILGLKLHPMQQTLISMSGGRQSDDSTRLLRMLEIEFINRTNEVGVDLNRCNQCPHTANILQFVSGLGPRKAQHILKVLRHQRTKIAATLSQDVQLKTYPVATNRLFLVTKCTLGRRVFINCAGFIKFDYDTISKEIDEDDEYKESQNSQMDEAKYIEILDSTRVHPETYDWARKMAIDALDLDENEGDTNANNAIKEVLENSKKLKDLDLDAFADELKRTGHGVKNTTLNDIRLELTFRYQDKRKKFHIMNDEELFYSLIKETSETFYINKLIMCRCIGIAHRSPKREQLEEANPIKDDNTCMWQCQFCKRNDFAELGQVWSHFDSGECPGPAIGIRTILDNGCSGFIPLKFLSDQQVTNPEERIKIGMTIHARIIKIEFKFFRVDLTSRSSDLRDLNDKFKPQRDEYYDYRAQNDDQFKLDEKKRKEEHKQTYTKRIIAHPQFKNIGYSQAVAYLKDMDIGDALIRPSSKGNDHLTVTWKIDKNCYQHVDVLEEKKQNAFSVGKRLIIEGEDYEDLDEILARYIAPMINYVREIMSHKNYKDVDYINSYMGMTQMSQSQLDESAITDSLLAKNVQIESYLWDERSKNSARIPYVFTCCRNLPGRFMISYMIKDKLRNEYIKITHEGFKFREKLFASFNQMLNWFKEHYHEPIPFKPPPPPPPQNASQVQNLSSMVTDMSINSMFNNNNRNRTPLQQSNFNDMPPSYSGENKKYDGNGRDNYRGGGRGGRGGGRGRGGFNGERGGGRGGYRGSGRGGYNQNRNPNWEDRQPQNSKPTSNNDDWDNGPSQPVSREPVSYSNLSSSRNDDDWDDPPVVPKQPAFNNNNNNNNTSKYNQNTVSQPRPPASNDDDWDDEPSRPVQTFNPNTYSNNNHKKSTSSAPTPQPPNRKVTTSNDDDWDDEPSRPVQTFSNNRSNNNYNKPSVPAPAQPLIRTTTTTTNNNDDDWDDPPVVPKQPAFNNNNNNNNTSKYNQNAVSQPRPPASNDDDWDDEPSRPVQTFSTNQSNNKYINYSKPTVALVPTPPPRHHPQNRHVTTNNDDDWDDEPPRLVQTLDSNNQSSYNYNKPPPPTPPAQPIIRTTTTMNNNNDDWDDEPTQPTRSNFNNYNKPQQNQYKPTPTPPTAPTSRVDDEDWD